MTMPVAFVSHGAPSLALDAADPIHRFLRGFSQSLAEPAGDARGACVHGGWAYHLLSRAAFRWT
jgi:hypothetical protein